MPILAPDGKLDATSLDDLIAQLREAIHVGRLPQLKRSDLARLFGVHISTIDRWRVEGVLPQPIRLGSSRSSPRWRVEDIARFLQDRGMSAQQGQGSALAAC
jgi:predicted DNA-binding transcriptional regulator AlpA